ncbi:MAG: NADP-dependent isocitrate dehydrogenase [Planctomycetota bacterium]|nr:NADP-dependent isocitrate dehydrogenase [Planctomycetota bacterium]
MSDTQPTIFYTKTDEAPALATYSFLPIVRAFTRPAGVAIELADISLSSRILANFPDFLTDQQQQPNTLEDLGDLAKTPRANIIKLPNISASIPQLNSAIQELQEHGYRVPDYPEDPTTEAEQEIKSRYAKVLGSAVNPVLREGNSDRRVAAPVKAYAKSNPHSMGKWSSESKTHVASMDDGDFYSSEQSWVTEAEDNARIEFVDLDGNRMVLRDSIPLEKGEVLDSSRMNCGLLREFIEQAIEDAQQQDLLFSLHLKATMMKVSDPIIFGHVVTVYYESVFEKHAETIKDLGVEPNNGIGDLYSKISALEEAQQRVIKADVESLYANRPRLAMVDSDRGVTNLHVPSDVIIDASMPAAIRSSGKMWGPDGQLHDTKAVIPDRSYAGVYQAVIQFCKENGAFDVSTMGNVSNVGLMAQKAEEYGSHDKTFEISRRGTVKVVDSRQKTLMEHAVDAGDIWRMCQTKDAPIKDWVRLAVSRARATGSMAIFWLDANRAHDANLIKKINEYLPEHDTDGLEIEILAPVEAARVTCQRCKDGLDTISVTGNVLRDYLTDLFPILELGTSAKMLSIVPLLSGGGLYETGAGGSAPKHVQQFLQEGHLRWDSLGEFLALTVSLEDLGDKTGNPKIGVIADALDKANALYLANDKSPSRRVNELDNRGTHFYLALYWAQGLAEQEDDLELKKLFRPIADQLTEKETVIIEELNSSQGSSVEIGGYYQPCDDLCSNVMRPSQTFNTILALLD